MKKILFILLNIVIIRAMGQTYGGVPLSFQLHLSEDSIHMITLPLVSNQALSDSISTCGRCCHRTTHSAREIPVNILALNMQNGIEFFTSTSAGFYLGQRGGWTFLTHYTEHI